MKKIVVSEKYQCILCLREFDTHKEAESCRRNDSQDGFSKLAAWRNRQRVLKKNKKGGLSMKDRFEKWDCCDRFNQCDDRYDRYDRW